MRETRKFVKESVIYGVGEVFTKALAFLLIPLYTRYLTKSDFGIYNLVITIWPVLVIFYGKGLASYLIRGYFELTTEKQKKDFFGTILLLTILISLLLSGIIHLFGDYIFNPLFKEVSYKPFLQFAVAIAFFKLFINNLLSIYRAQRKPVTVVILSFVMFVITVSVIVWQVVILKKELWGVLWGQFISLALVSLIFFIYVQKDIHYHLDKKYIYAALTFSLPLIPHALSGWIINLSDRILIERFCTLEDLAIYSLGYQLAMALDILINSMNQAWIPFFYANAANPDQRKELKKSTTFYFIIVVAVGLLLGVFTNEIILLVGKEQYRAAIRIFPLIILAFIIHSIYYMASASLLLKKKTMIIPLITIVAGVINVGLNLYGLPKYGYMFAAYTTVFSYSLMSLGGVLFSWKYFPIPFQFTKMLLILFFAAGIYALSGLFSALPLLPQIGLKIFLLAFFPISLVLLRIVRIHDIQNFKGIFFSVNKNSKMN